MKPGSVRGVKPIAPPVYRPQSTPKVLQRKQAITQPHKASASAPPVYKPQPLPKVLQRRANLPPAAVQKTMGRAPVAPPVYQPNKTAVGLQQKPSSTPKLSTVQRKTPGTNNAPARPPIASARPPIPSRQQQPPPNLTARPTVIQRFIRMVTDAEKIPLPARQAIAHKLGPKAQVSDDLKIARYGQLAYLHPSVVRAAKLGRTDTTDTIKWESETGTTTLYRLIVPDQSSDDCGRVARRIMSKIHSISSTSTFKTADEKKADAKYPRVVERVQGDESTLKRLRRNRHANPDLGEAYVIIPPLDAVTKVNFHWGAVIAKSGGDVLTLEGYAGTGKEEWTLELYSQTNLNEQDFQTFHDIWGGVGVANPHTFVVAPEGAHRPPTTTGDEEMFWAEAFSFTTSSGNIGNPGTIISTPETFDPFGPIPDIKTPVLTPTLLMPTLVTASSPTSPSRSLSPTVSTLSPARVTSPTSPSNSTISSPRTRTNPSPPRLSSPVTTTTTTVVKVTTLIQLKAELKTIEQRYSRDKWPGLITELSKRCDQQVRDDMVFDVELRSMQCFAVVKKVFWD
jgi:hypothetical protein